MLRTADKNQKYANQASIPVPQVGDVVEVAGGDHYCIARYFRHAPRPLKVVAVQWDKDDALQVKVGSYGEWLHVSHFELLEPAIPSPAESAIDHAERIDELLEANIEKDRLIADLQAVNARLRIALRELAKGEARDVVDPDLLKSLSHHYASAGPQGSVEGFMIGGARVEVTLSVGKSIDYWNQSLRAVIQMIQEHIDRNERLLTGVVER